MAFWKFSGRFCNVFILVSGKFHRLETFATFALMAGASGSSGGGFSGDSGTIPPDPYTVLGVNRNADAAAIRAAFRRLSRQWHPDINPVPEAAARFDAVVQAYHLLTNPAALAAYHRRRSGVNVSVTTAYGEGEILRRERGREVRPGMARARQRSLVVLAMLFALPMAALLVLLGIIVYVVIYDML